jgi:hypothetical protein
MEVRNQSGSFTSVLSPMRSSELLGKKVSFERSTALGFSPSTLMHAVSGIALSRGLELWDYDAHLAMAALKRSVEKGTKMRQSTLDDLHMALKERVEGGQSFTLEEIDQLPNSLATHWRILSRINRRGLGGVKRRLLVRLAFYDRVAHQIDRVTEREKGEQARRRIFGPSLLFWAEQGFGLQDWATLVLDATLHHLAWLETQRDTPSGAVFAAGSVLRLASPPKRPMRHWFDVILKTTKCLDLKELHFYLLSRGATHSSKNKAISHDLLRTWASTEGLVPDSAARALLKSFPEQSAISAYAQFRMARLLTFLTEFVVMFSAKPLASLDVQGALHERLKSLVDALQSRGEGKGTDLFIV